MDDFPHVFTPLTLRHRTLRSRINLGAHTTNMSEGGLPSERHIAYYRERAIGGAGMIVVEPVPVHATAVLTRGNFLSDDDAVVPHFRRLTDACHDAAAAEGGVVMIQQLYHVGQHGDAANSFRENWSPSGLPSMHDSDGSHAMTEAEIEDVIAAFIRAAVRARDAGFDGIELFAAYHALVDQFWTPWSNRRTDRWGGPLANRARFSAAVLDGIRAACGDDFIVGLAVNLDPGSDGSLSATELQEVVAWHDERALMDYVTCGTGSYFDFYALMPTSLYPARLGEPAAAALKSVVHHAVVQAESHIRTPADAEAVLAAGHADMVSIVRGQIADPHLVAKARAGHPERVRPCISCNQLCWGRRSRDYWISCLVNPSVGREAPWGGDRFDASRHAGSGARRRWRSGGSRGRTGQRRARPRRRARGGVRRARRAMAPRRAAADAVTGARPPRVVRRRARTPRRRRPPRAVRDGRRRGRRSGRPCHRGRRCGATGGRLPTSAAPRRPPAWPRARPHDHGAGRARRRGRRGGSRAGAR